MAEEYMFQFRLSSRVFHTLDHLVVIYCIVEVVLYFP